MKPFPGALCTLKYFYKKNPGLTVTYTGTNDIKSVSSPKEINNEIISSLSVKEKGPPDSSLRDYSTRRQILQKKLTTSMNVWE